jgi:DNA-directed RNA polymerase specialized sigma24 family protein
MEQDAIIPVDLDLYRRELRSAGLSRTAAKKRLDNCTDRLREVIRQSAAAGVSQAEIARLAGIPRITVRQWLGLK